MNQITRRSRGPIFRPCGTKTWWKTFADTCPRGTPSACVVWTLRASVWRIASPSNPCSRRPTPTSRRCWPGPRRAGRVSACSVDDWRRLRMRSLARPLRSSSAVEQTSAPRSPCTDDNVCESSGTRTRGCVVYTTKSCRFRGNVSDRLITHTQFVLSPLHFSLVTKLTVMIFEYVTSCDSTTKNMRVDHFFPFHLRNTHNARSDLRSPWPLLQNGVSIPVPCIRLLQIFVHGQGR